MNDLAWTSSFPPISPASPCYLCFHLASFLSILHRFHIPSSHICSVWNVLLHTLISSHTLPKIPSCIIHHTSSVISSEKILLTQQSSSGSPATWSEWTLSLSSQHLTHAFSQQIDAKPKESWGYIWFCLPLCFQTQSCCLKLNRCFFLFFMFN